MGSRYTRIRLWTCHKGCSCPRWLGGVATHARTRHMAPSERCPASCVLLSVCGDNSSAIDLRTVLFSHCFSFICPSSLSYIGKRRIQLTDAHCSCLISGTSTTAARSRSTSTSSRLPQARLLPWLAPRPLVQVHRSRLLRSRSRCRPIPPLAIRTVSRNIRRCPARPCLRSNCCSRSSITGAARCHLLSDQEGRAGSTRMDRTSMITSTTNLLLLQQERQRAQGRERKTRTACRRNSHRSSRSRRPR